MRLGATFGVNSIRKHALPLRRPRRWRRVRVHGASFLKVSLCEGRVMAQEKRKLRLPERQLGAQATIHLTSKGHRRATYKKTPRSTPDPPSGAEGERKPSLAERLRAEQRKTPEPKMDEPKPADLGDAAAASPRKQPRAAAPQARRRAGWRPPPPMTICPRSAA